MITVALDVGFGNTKGVADGGKTTVFPSVVAIRTTSLGMAGIGVGAQQTTPVAFGGMEFFVGANAHLWGQVVENLDFSRLTSPEARALIYAAMYSLLPGAGTVNLVIGLPVPLLQSPEAAREVLADLKNSLMGEHQAKVKGRWVKFSVAGIRVAAQPVGAWVDWALDDNGALIRPQAKKEIVAILDIGFNTLDLYGIQGGKAVPRLIGGEKLGVRRLLEIAHPQVPFHQATGLQIPESAVKIWMSEIAGCVERAWGEFPFDRLILTGGGVEYLKSRLTHGRLTRGGSLPIHIPDNPVLANARGLWKWGLTQWRGESPREAADSRSP